MSRRNREQPVVRAYTNQDDIDLVSDDDWDEYEARLLKRSSTATTATAPASVERKAKSPSESSPPKRKREAGGTSPPTDSGERAPKRPRRSDESKSGKSLDATCGSRKNPIDVPKDIIDVGMDDASHSINSVVEPASFGPSGRRSFSTKPTEVHVSADLSCSPGPSTSKRLSKLVPSVDVASVPDTSPRLGAQTGPPKPPVVTRGLDNDEGIVPVTKPKGKSAGGPKLVRPEKKKTKKQIEAEKKALDLREKKMTRREFIQYVYGEKLKENLENAPPKRLVLKDKIVWYAEPGDAKASDSLDRQRYEMLVRYGATVVPDFDHATVTHVIFPSYMKSDGQALARMGYTKYSQIPEGIKTVSWNWASRSVELKRIVPEQPYERFEIRLPPKPVIPFRRNGARIVDSEDEDSEVRSKDRIPHIGRGRTKVNIRVEQQLGPEPLDITTATENPLLPFYTEAKKEIAEEEMADFESAENRKWSSFQCMKQQPKTISESPNEDIMRKLDELKKLHEGKPSDDDHWRKYTYQKVLGRIRAHPRRITSYEEARTIDGIGHKTAEKIMEIIRTGELERIKYERTEDVVVAQIFTKIYGVGPVLARRWYLEGLRTLDDVRNRKNGIKLSPHQELGLKYYDDLDSRMPREEASDIFERIKAVALYLDPKLELDLMGSYRRGLPTCGDIDILVTRPTADGRNHAGILQRLLPRLREEGILTGDLGTPEDDNALEAKYMGICRRSPEDKMRRIDILTIPNYQWGAALVYFTGDDIFNRSMRLLANMKGLSLNQRGLWSGVVRDPKTRKKTSTGVIIASRTEKEIFAALGVPWKEPHERRCS